MSTKPITFRQVSWRLALQGRVALCLLVCSVVLVSAPPIIRRLQPKDKFVVALVLACLLYVGVIIGVRFLVFPKLNRGVKLLKKARYEEALTIFQETSEYFSRHPRLDQYRWLLRMDSTSMSYREISLINIAACYFHLGQAEQSKLAYEKVLAEYPENAIALNALKAIKLYGEMKSGQAPAREGTPEP